MDINPWYIVDSKGRKLKVVLPIKVFNRIIKEIESSQKRRAAYVALSERRARAKGKLR